MPLATYDPAKVSVIWNGFEIRGFAKGSFITFDANEDLFSLYAGSQGDCTRAKSNNSSGIFKLKLMQASKSNAILSASIIADKATNGGLATFFVKDGNGDNAALSKTAWIKKQPTFDYSNEAGEIEWEIETDSAQIFIGGI